MGSINMPPSQPAGARGRTAGLSEGLEPVRSARRVGKSNSPNRPPSMIWRGTSTRAQEFPQDLSIHSELPTMGIQRTSGDEATRRHEQLSLGTVALPNDLSVWIRKQASILNSNRSAGVPRSAGPLLIGDQAAVPEVVRCAPGPHF